MQSSVLTLNWSCIDCFQSCFCVIKLVVVTIFGIFYLHICTNYHIIYCKQLVLPNHNNGGVHLAFLTCNRITVKSTSCPATNSVLRGRRNAPQVSLGRDPAFWADWLQAAGLSSTRCCSLNKPGPDTASGGQFESRNTCRVAIFLSYSANAGFYSTKPEVVALKTNHTNNGGFYLVCISF